LAVPGVCAGFSPAVERRGYSLALLLRLLIVEHRLQGMWASGVVAQGLGCSMACEIVPFSSCLQSFPASGYSV